MKIKRDWPNCDHVASGQLNSCNRISSNSLYVQAEADSKKRRESVENVCQKSNLTNILAPPNDPKDRIRGRQRLNLRQHLILNEEHKVLFCFIPKVSCTMMKKIFVVMGNLYPSIRKVRMVEKGVVRFTDSKFTEEQRNYMLKNFYKFMIVRDPFERLVSAYRNKFESNDEHFRHVQKIIIEKYRQNKTERVETGDRASFTEFVRHLIDTPAWTHDQHWMAHEDVCRPCDVKYDFIGSIDTLERDLAYVMRKIHANETKHHVNQDSGALAKTKLLTASFFKKVPKEYFDKLLAIRKADFELFGYPLPKYESLDKHYHA